MKIKSLLIVISILFTSKLFATEAMKENIKVHSILPLSPYRTASKGKKIIRISINNQTWGINCRGTEVDLILPEDSHIYATLLFAMQNGQTINMSVDDNQKPIDDVCRVAYITAFNNL